MLRLPANLRAQLRCCLRWEGKLQIPRPATECGMHKPRCAPFLRQDRRDNKTWGDIKRRRLEASATREKSKAPARRRRGRGTRQRHEAKLWREDKEPAGRLRVLKRRERRENVENGTPRKNPHRISMRVRYSVIIGRYEFRRRRRAIPTKPKRPLPRRSSEEGSGTGTDGV
jgi:hypothetical protein